MTDEVADVEVRAGEARATSDDEGYLRSSCRRPPALGGGAGRDRGRPETRTPFPARVPGAEARWLVISDVDDTVIETGAHCLRRNLWTTFTGSAATRRIHGDARELLGRLAEGDRNPVFYVSSSPGTSTTS